MSKVGEYYRELEEMGIEERLIRRAKKDIKKAADKRNSRKTPYPYGFEYKKESK